MEALWAELKEVLAEVDPALIEDLPDGATDADIERVESLLNAKLPQEFIEFYKIHDGYPYRVFDGDFLMPLSHAIKEYEFWMSNEGNLSEIDPEMADEEVKPFFFNRKWFPFSSDECANHRCIDLDPSDKGHVGQVIRYWHDSSDRILDGKSLKDWILKFIEKIREEQFEYSEESKFIECYIGDEGE